MFGKTTLAALSLLLAACVTPATSEADPQQIAIAPDQQAFLDACKAWDEWDKPAPPFEIFAGTYHVGTCGISAILITSDDGHVLIDSGTEKGADVVLANIAALGFDIEDVKFLLSSHEHFDHVAGMAKLQRASGAIVVASAAAAPVLETGVISANDPQAGTHPPFEGARVGEIIAGGDAVQLGQMEITAIETPGHSPGALSWAWQECEERCENIVYADSLSPVSSEPYKFSDHLLYLAEYRAGLARLGRQECSLLLTPHPSHSRMLKRMQAGKLIQNAPGEKPCADYAAGKFEDIKKRLLKEQGETQ